VLRVYDRELGFAVAQRCEFENVRSTVELAAPWFIGAAMGLQVLGTFSVGQSCFVVGAMHVGAGSELDGVRMFDLSTQTRVIAITRPDAPIRMHPRRDALLNAGDTVFLVGPYRELLATLRKGQPPAQPTTSYERSRQDQEVNFNFNADGVKKLVPKINLSVDQSQCDGHNGRVPQEERALIDAVERRLVEKYATLPAGDVAAVVQHAYTQFQKSTVRDFIPLLVERRASEELANLTGAAMRQLA
jgi:hypothetical protein